jgi:hypothetical protein
MNFYTIKAFATKKWQQCGVNIDDFAAVGCNHIRR